MISLSGIPGKPLSQEERAQRLWHPSQTLADHPDGSLALTLRVAPTVEAQLWQGAEPASRAGR